MGRLEKRKTRISPENSHVEKMRQKMFFRHKQIVSHLQKKTRAKKAVKESMQLMFVRGNTAAKIKPTEKLHPVQKKCYKKLLLKKLIR